MSRTVASAPPRHGPCRSGARYRRWDWPLASAMESGMNPNRRVEQEGCAHQQRSRGPSLNSEQLIGRLAADPEVRLTANGGQVGTLRVATSWQDRTEYHTLVVFGSQAKFAGEYLAKGRLVFAEGRLQARQWTAQDGTQHRTTEVIAHSVQVLGPRPRRDESAPAEVERDETELGAER